MAWDRSRYGGGAGLADAPVAEVARLATAIIRGERFSDGTIDSSPALPRVARRLAGRARGGGEARSEAAGVSDVREVAASWPDGDGRLRKHRAQPLLVFG